MLSAAIAVVQAVERQETGAAQVLSALASPVEEVSLHGWQQFLRLLGTEFKVAQPELAASGSGGIQGPYASGVARCGSTSSPGCYSGGH